MKKYLRRVVVLGCSSDPVRPRTRCRRPPQIAVTSAPSQSSGGVFPTTNGNSTTYEYTITDGGSVTDGIPVMFCITGAPTTDPPVWTSFQVQIGNKDGGNLPGVTYPAP